MRKILHSDPILKKVKMSNHCKFFSSFKICYYLRLKLPNNNVTHGFLKNLWILVQVLKLIGHFWKRFWTIKKIAWIPPLFHNKKFISNFRDKAELFNNFFEKQGVLIENVSEIPATFNIKTTKTLSSVPVNRADIAK